MFYFWISSETGSLAFVLLPQTHHLFQPLFFILDIYFSVSSFQQTVPPWHSCLSFCFCWTISPSSLVQCNTIVTQLTVSTTFSCRYRSLVQTIGELRGKLLLGTAPRLEAPIMHVRPVPAVVEEDEEDEPPPQAPLQQSSTVRSSSRRLWKGLQQVPLIHQGLHVITWCRQKYSILAHIWPILGVLWFHSAADTAEEMSHAR